MSKRTTSVCIEAATLDMVREKAERFGVSQSQMIGRVLEIALPFMTDGFTNFYSTIKHNFNQKEF